MDQATIILNQVLPIFILIAIGSIARSTGMISTTTVDALKTLVIRLILPSVLFLSFLDMELKTEYLSMFVLIFFLCVAGFFAGRALCRAAGMSHPYAPYLMTGYEYGMLGISLFAGAYGLGAIGTIAVVALGHELFIWFVFFTLLLIARDGRTSIQAVVPRFFTNPVVIAILGGIALNLLGVHSPDIDGLPVAGAVMRTLRFLAPLTVPLVLIIVGHGMHIERRGLGAVIRLVCLRLSLQMPLAVIASVGVVGHVLQLDARFQVAVATLMLLPPPFIVPLFMDTGADMEDERRFVYKVLTIHTVVSLGLFTGLLILRPTL